MTHATLIERPPGPVLPRPDRGRGERRLRMLVTSAGRRVELIGCFRAAAADLGVEIEILACDLHPGLSPACRAADASFAVPRVTDGGYIDAVLDLCRAHDVALLVPTIDPELLPLSAARDRFRAAGVTIAVGDTALIDIARDKLATAVFLASHGIAGPRTALLEDVVAAPGDWAWPVIAKPRHGSAGRNVRILNGADELASLTVVEPMIVQELLAAPEFTVNMFFDVDGALRCAVPHERLQVRAGEVEKGITRRLPELAALARQLAAALPGPYGALCFQVMRSAAGVASILEINARFGGGYPLAHRAGATFARWLLEDRLGLPSTANDDWQDEVMMLRYDAAVFVVP